jgi:RimJ/RimL family protein N-acetyltransferase
VDWPIAPLTTARLVVRAAVDADSALFERVLTDATIRRHLGGPVPAADLERRIAELPWRGVFTILLRETEDPIGLVHIGRYRTGDLELSYEFLPEHWGAGYATEACAAVLGWAFADVAAGARIVAVTQSANSASVALLARLGMTKVDEFEEWGEPQSMFAATAPTTR